VLDGLAAAQAAYTREALGAGGWEAWSASLGERIGRVRQTLEEVAGRGALNVSRLLVAAGALDDLAAGAR